MKAYDFEYDGINLSNFGFIICDFDSNGIQNISNGSQINFDMISTLNSSKYELVNTEYNDYLQTTFQICKDPEIYDSFDISFNELREMTRWLKRKEFHKFKLFEVGYYDLYFEGSFNINKLEYGDKIIGLELNLITNRPYALHDPKKIIIENEDENGTKCLVDSSDEEGFIYPYMEIEVLENGNLSIYNDLDDRTMKINNCSIGEIITLDYPMIESSLSSHKIQNDFNWDFFRISNTYNTRKNNLTISIPCRISITYSPVIKLGI